MQKSKCDSISWKGRDPGIFGGEGFVKVDPEARRYINKLSGAETDLCWTCATCDNECPVNWATNRLRPRTIVRMATLGLLDEALDLPSLWYCLTCKRCNQTCPTRAKPADLILFLRGEAVRRKRVSEEARQRYSDFFSRFQRVRWHAVSHCMDRGMPPLSDEGWNEWLNDPVKSKDDTIDLHGRLRRSKAMNEIADRCRSPLCVTCGECTNACPLKRERALFDPQWIVRMVNLRQTEDILRSPALWLCIGCQRCTDACRESVRVHAVIEALREQALSSGTVGSHLKPRLEEAYRTIFSRYIQEIDAILGDSPSERCA